MQTNETFGPIAAKLTSDRATIEAHKRLDAAIAVDEDDDTDSPEWIDALQALHDTPLPDAGAQAAKLVTTVRMNPELSADRADLLGLLRDQLTAAGVEDVTAAKLLQVGDGRLHAAGMAATIEQAMRAE